jgi:DNA-binding NtrC family response regulator
VNVRIVAATNRDLETAVAEGAFRADLYYRLNVLTIEAPPLRERDGDVMLLARYFMERTVQRYGLSTKTLTPEAEVALLQYPWPGNVRELAHVVERAVLLHKEGQVDAEMLRLSVPRFEVPVVVEAGGRVRVDFSAGNIVLDEVERELIRQALQASGWNRTEAAQRLGMSRDTLRYRIEKYRLDPAPAGA